MDDYSDIFKSNFKLNFNNSDLQKEYSSIISKRVMSLCLIYTILHFLIAIGGTIIFVYSNSINKSYSTNFFAILISSYVVSSVYVILIVINLIWMRNLKVLRIINYINFYLIVLLFGHIRNHVINVANDSFGYAMLCIGEFLFRQAYMVLGTLDFTETFVIIAMNCCTYFLYWPFMVPSVGTAVHYRNACFVILWICELILYYFYLKEQKRSFYYIKKSEEKCMWYMNIFDNMNTGFLHMKNGKIEYTNKEIYRRLANEVHMARLLKES